MRTDEGENCPPPGATGESGGRGSLPTQHRVSPGTDQEESRPSALGTNGHIGARKQIPLYDLIAERVKPQAIAKYNEDFERAKSEQRERRRELVKLNESSRLHTGEKPRGQVEIYPHGRRMKSLYRITPPKSRGEGRGKVTGISLKSVKRLKALLLEHVEPSGWECYAVDLTIPGPEPLQSESDKLRKNFMSRLERAGLSGVWRKEKQPGRGENGVEHWHCVVWCPSEFQASIVYVWWWECLKNMGSVEWKGIRSTRELLPGAVERSARVQRMHGDKTARFRYLMQHTAKRKAAQIADTGRAWGKFGWDRMSKVLPVVIELTEQEFSEANRLSRRINCSMMNRVIKEGKHKGGTLSKRAWRRRMSSRAKCWGMRGTSELFDSVSRSHLVITNARLIADGKKGCTT